MSDDPETAADSKQTHRAVAEFDRDGTQSRLDLTIAAREEAITPAVEEIMRSVSQIQSVNGKELDIEIALREALANAIKHGCQNDSSKQVQCCVFFERDRGILIIVRDPGDGFDPLAIPDCTIGEHLYENHGRGIYLINKLMDEVSFERGGTEIHMRKY